MLTQVRQDATRTARGRRGRRRDPEWVNRRRHGLTQYTAGQTYVAQSGALNESISDVFGALVRQRHLDRVRPKRIG
jgi:hypothetical protein